MASSTLMQLRRMQHGGKTGIVRRLQAIASGMLAPLAAPSGPGGSAVAQRNPTERGEGYFNGKKTLYELDGEHGLFIKSGEKGPSGFPYFKRVVEASGTDPHGLKMYRLDDNKYKVELDTRTEKEKLIAHMGTGSFGGQYVVFPGRAYPHLSVEYWDDGALTLGDAHYSTSHDDGARLSYPRRNGRWAYEPHGTPAGLATNKPEAYRLVEKLHNYFGV